MAIAMAHVASRRAIAQEIVWARVAWASAAMASATELAAKPYAIAQEIVPARVVRVIVVIPSATQPAARTIRRAHSIAVASAWASAGTACATFASTTIARAVKIAERVPESGAPSSGHAVVESLAFATGSTK